MCEHGKREVKLNFFSHSSSLSNATIADSRTLPKNYDKKLRVVCLKCNGSGGHPKKYIARNWQNCIIIPNR